MCNFFYFLTILFKNLFIETIYNKYGKGIPSLAKEEFS